MILKIKNRIEKELADYIRGLNSLYFPKKYPPLLFDTIKGFVSRKGKRIRPVLFVIGYLGFRERAPAGLYRTALSFELLHDFMLVHDDIIDKCAKRRGEPSMHRMLNAFLAGQKNLKFDGVDLAIVVGDVMYALSFDAFLAVDTDAQRKEMALKKLIETAIYTGSGEFGELINATVKIKDTAKEDIYRIYDLKTAKYSFAAPLEIASMLAGADKKETDLLSEYGIHLGRAFQIKDDIIGIFCKESEIGKPVFTDLKEGKKTFMLWQAYQNSGAKNKGIIEKMLRKRKVTQKDSAVICRIILDTGALEQAKKEISRLILKAEGFLRKSGLRQPYKNLLADYSRKILSL